MDIRVTCPNCETALEIDARDAGEMVLCGSCREVFHPPIHEGRPISRRYRDDDYDDRPRRRYDDEEDEDDYNYRPPQRRRPSAGGDGLAITSLVLGILACVVFCCWPFSLTLGGLGTVFGALGLKSSSRSLAIAGLTLSLVGIIFGGGFAVVTLAGVAKAEYEHGSQTNPKRPFFQDEK